MAHVLVADDDADVRSVLRKALTKMGHQVWDVADGAEALELLKTTPFDLVLTDVYMTEMNGVELLVRIQQLKLGVPVVVISGGGVRSSAEVLNAAATRGAAAVLDKPFTLDELRETIEPILTRRV